MTQVQALLISLLLLCFVVLLIIHMVRTQERRLLHLLRSEQLVNNVFVSMQKLLEEQDRINTAHEEMIVALQVRTRSRAENNAAKVPSA